MARQHLDDLLAELAQNGVDHEYRHPRTGRTERLRIERVGLAGVVRNLLYVPQLAGLLPLAVERARAGDYGPFLASADAFARGARVSKGMFLSVVCAEDVPRFSDAEAESLARGTFLGSEWLADMRAECDHWPAARLPDSYFEPVTSDVPALLLSGHLDPVTPPSWAEVVAEGLSRSRHVIVPGAAHGTTSLGCIPELIAEFLETLDGQALDASCAERLKRPAFFTSLQGPAP